MVLVPVVMYAPPGLAIRSTPVLPQLFQAVFILYAIWLGAFSSRRIFKANRLVLLACVVLFAVILWTTFRVAPNRDYSLEKLYDLILFVGVLLGGAYIFQSGGAKLMRQTYRAIFGSLLLAVPLVSFLYWIRIPSYIAWPEILPGFVFIRIYGFSLAAGIAVGTGLLVLRQFQERPQRRVVVLGLVMLWTALFWSGSRGGVVALLLGLPISAILVPMLRTALLPAGKAMILGAAISSLIPVPNQKFGFFNIWFELTRPDSLDDFGTGRIAMWKQAWGLIVERPWFGYGYAQHAYVADIADRDFVHLHSHNMIIDALLAWGWVGTVCLGFLIIRAWKRGLAKTHRGDVAERTPAFLLVNVLLIYSMVDGVYFYYHALIPWAFGIAVLAANVTGETGSSKQA